MGQKEKKMAKGIFGKLVFFLNVGFCYLLRSLDYIFFYFLVTVAFLQEGVIVSGAFWFFGSFQLS